MFQYDTKVWCYVIKLVPFFWTYNVCTWNPTFCIATYWPSWDSWVIHISCICYAICPFKNKCFMLGIRLLHKMLSLVLEFFYFRLEKLNPLHRLRLLV